MNKDIFIKRYEQLGEKFKEVKIRQSIRVNSLKISDEELVKRLKDVKLEEIKWLDHGYYAKAKFSLASTPEHLQGHYYIQDSAAQLPVQVLKPKRKLFLIWLLHLAEKQRRLQL